MQNKPSPFLRRPIDNRFNALITEGWIYSEDEQLMHGVKIHQSVDFAVPLGTPVLAVADGLAVASFTEVKVPDKNGQQKIWHGKPIYFGAGLVIKIFHANGWCTLYGHLHKLDNALLNAGVYYQPVQENSGDLASKNLRIPFSDVGNKVNALRVKAGQVIAYSGITGMGWGEPTYANWLDGKSYAVCDEEHLHFQVLFSDTNKNDEYTSIDPFGLYEQYQVYPDIHQDWTKLPDSLWLPEN